MDRRANRRFNQKGVQMTVSFGKYVQRHMPLEIASENTLGYHYAPKSKTLTVSDVGKTVSQ